MDHSVYYNMPIGKQIRRVSDTYSDGRSAIYLKRVHIGCDNIIF